MASGAGKKTHDQLPRAEGSRRGDALRGVQRRAAVFFLMIRRPPRSTLDRSSAASDVYKRQGGRGARSGALVAAGDGGVAGARRRDRRGSARTLSLIHISEPTRLLSNSYA